MSRRSGFGIKRLMLSGRERAATGCIVQFSNGVAKHFVGKDSLSEAAKFADQFETKIKVISTVDTIYRDMQGTRHSIITNDRRIQDAMFLPELRMLAHIKRKDLFDDGI